jgi:pyruvate dehydrogenase E2 component (dihydrolipoamide acetyltransferase)
VSNGGGLKGSVEIVEPTAAERAIARRAAEARATVPDLELSVDVDMSAALKLDGSTTAVLVRATALAVRDHPRANAAYRDGHFELYSRVNAGVLLASGETAAILDADAKPLADLTREIDVLERRTGELSPAERSGATFTLAHYAVTRGQALISPPQAIAVAAGEVRELAAIRDGAVVAIRGLALTLACDHRILHGAQAASVLAQIRDLLEDGAL